MTGRLFLLQCYNVHSLSLESTSSENKDVIDVHETLSTASNGEVPCGPHCEGVTNLNGVQPKRSCWSFVLHEDQKQVVYPFSVIAGIGNERKGEGQVCITVLVNKWFALPSSSMYWTSRDPAMR